MRPQGLRAATVAKALLGLAIGAAAAAASATSAQGYALAMTPLAHHGTRWLLVQVVERSDPNTTTATGALPPMTRERAFWMLVDGLGRPLCRVKVAAELPAAQRADALHRLRAACGQAAEGPARWIDGGAAAGFSWSAHQVCAGERCVAAAARQYSIGGARSSAAATGTPAAARCVAGRWLIVTNLDDAGASPGLEGARFHGLPPRLRGDIVGHETVRIDGVARVPPGLDCP
jgi:hypothetical protein